MQNYKILEKVKDTSLFQQFSAKKNETDSEFQLKKYQSTSSSGIVINAIREINALKKLKSRHIVELCEVFTEDKALYLVLEQCSFTLSSLISQKFRFTPDIFDSITFQLFQATNFIHKNGMIHRNLNPENILLTSTCQLKLTGFDFCRYESDHMTNNITSIFYRAPELLLGDFNYNNKVDSWSLGCILVEMKTGEPPFKGTDEISQCKLILKTFGNPDCEYPWCKLFESQRFTVVDSLDQIIQNKFGNIFDEKLLMMIKELFQINKHRRLSVHNALRLSAIRRGEDIVCQINPSDFN